MAHGGGAIIAAACASVHNSRSGMDNSFSEVRHPKEVRCNSNVIYLRKRFEKASPLRKPRNTFEPRKSFASTRETLAMLQAFSRRLKMHLFAVRLMRLWSTGPGGHPPLAPLNTRRLRVSEGEALGSSNLWPECPWRYSIYGQSMSSVTLVTQSNRG